jgi:hypothetical protein
MDKRNKAKVATRLAIASAVLLALTFVIKEIFKEQLRDIRDSLTTARTEFQSQSDQSSLHIQILAAQQQIELANMNLARGDPHHDYTPETQQATAEARQAQAQLHADFDAVSRLIDSVPFGGQLRQLRDQARQTIDQTDNSVNATLTGSSTSTEGPGRWVMAKTATVMALIAELPVIILGGAAKDAAERVQQWIEKLIRICNWALWVFGLSGAGLGIYSAAKGIQFTS